MRTAHVFLSVCSLLLWSASAPATSFGQRPDTVYALDEITVTATRSRTSPAHVPQRVTVLDADDRRMPGSDDVADLLEARSGLFIRRYGSGLATPSARGAGPSQMLLLIDGLRLSDPQLGQFDLSLLPSFVFESAEIVHGPTSALYGTDGMAGTVNLRRMRPETDRVSLLTEVGAFGARRVSGGWSVVGSGASALVAAEYGYTDGDFPYLNDALFPSREVRRRNADREQRSLFATVEAESGGHVFTGAVLFAGAQQGLPGIAGSPPKGERRWDEHLRIWLRDELSVAGSRLSMQAFAHRGKLRYVHPQLSVDDTGRTLTSGMEASIQRPLDERWLLVTGASGGFASARHPSLAAASDEMHGALYASASAAYTWWRLYPALRVDFYSQSEEPTRAAVSPRLGANVTPFPSLPLYLKANIGTAFRMPTFNDRFWRPGGDPGLDPERSLSAEGGLYLDHPAAAVELTAFSSRTTDQIVWLNEDGDTWSPRNLSRTVATGIEASLRVTRTKPLRGGLIYSLTRAVDRSESGSGTFGRQLRYVPLHQTKAYISAVHGPLRLDISARILGRRYVTGDESEYLRPVAVVDASARFEERLGSFSLGLSIVAENVSNTSYAIIQGYPMPPRHGRIQLTLKTR